MKKFTDSRMEIFCTEVAAGSDPEIAWTVATNYARRAYVSHDREVTQLLVAETYTPEPWRAASVG